MVALTGIGEIGLLEGFQKGTDCFCCLNLQPKYKETKSKVKSSFKNKEKQTDHLMQETILNEFIDLFCSSSRITVSKKEMDNQASL